MADQRKSNLQGILRWSLQQQDEAPSEGRAAQIDPEVKRPLRQVIRLQTRCQTHQQTLTVSLSAKLIAIASMQAVRLAARFSPLLSN